LLRLYTIWKLDDSSNQQAEALKAIKESYLLQRYTQRQFNKLVGSLHIPTYDKLTHFQYNDVLISFVKYFFEKIHKREYTAR
jgi:hypothetical protein